ncbi:hypothetical protein ACNTMW_30920 [Planosporangium sp. 12N6]|uniref:hypothetical protein n=1 Tax=Planosporangium spinosum TaxID=3402278 RepID=UPI003CEB0F5A
MDRGIRGGLGNWNADEVDRFELAQQTLRTLIAAYSARIAGANDVEADRLRAERSRYADELRRLDPTDTATLARIAADYPALVDRVRNLR